jgi:hypothetical protein
VSESAHFQSRSELADQFKKIEDAINKIVSSNASSIYALLFK